MKGGGGEENRGRGKVCKENLGGISEREKQSWGQGGK